MAQPLPYCTGDMGVTAAISLFKLRLRRDTQLLSQVPGLSGKRLLCHCKPSAPCHADAIIEVFGDLQSSDFELLSRGLHPPRAGDVEKDVLDGSTSEEDEFGSLKPKRNSGWLGRGAMVPVF